MSNILNKWKRNFPSELFVFKPQKTRRNLRVHLVILLDCTYFVNQKISKVWRPWDLGLLLPSNSLTQFLERLNIHHPVQFTWHNSSSKVTFLDVYLRVNHGQLHTSVHVKPTNLQQYLHFSSCHPSSNKRSIPYSLAIRGRRICSHPDDLHT